MSGIYEKRDGETEVLEDNIWDDSTSFAVQQRILPDGRTFEAEMWGEDGYTFLTYRFTSQGLERLSKDQVVQYLLTQDISIDLVKFPLENIRLNPDFGDSDLYNLTLTIGESDD